ncbi:MAG: hypothetical protein NUV77_15190 [Thermoguttaceae bacterium]|jgi:hypothetical protein|nr:hypothetical protein [Thermoguttaceae bacterium]
MPVASAAIQAQARLAEARHAKILRDTASAAQRLAAADRAYQQGDVRAATLVYARVGVSRSAGPVAVEARQRLAKLAEDARQRMREIDAMLESRAAVSGDSANAPAGDPVLPDVVEAAFRKYDELEYLYGEVPAVKRELAAHLARQRNRPEFAAVLREPEAKEHVAIARQHEQEGDLCCAYWAYQAASGLVPAPSAIDARQRLDEMGKDARLVAEAEACRNVRWCLAQFERASKLERTWPRKAKEIYEEIVRRAPRDSGVFSSAKKQYDALP